MISGWHLTNLPVWVSGNARPVSRVDELVVSWETRSLEGLLLAPRWCLPVFLPIGNDVRLTDMGVTLGHRSTMLRRPRKFRRHILRMNAAWKGRVVVSQGGRLYGRLKDVVIDQETASISYLVISRGVVGDLMLGASLVPIQQLTEFGERTVKIFVPGES